MSVKILSTLELSGMEKVTNMHGGWMTICHAAHLTGDQSIIVKNISCAIRHLLKRHSRMRSRLQINDHQQLLQLLEYDELYFNPDLFYTIVEANDESWQTIAEKECHRNPFSDNHKSIFPLFHFMLICKQNSQSSNDNLFHLLLFSNHCASDGRSGFILINDFLTLITSPDLYNRIEPVNTQVIPCIVQLTPRPYGLLYPVVLSIGKHMFKRQLRKLQHPRIPVKTTFLDGESTPFPIQPIHYHFIFASSSTTLYTRLHEKCRSQQTTLHGPLLVCLLLAIHRCFPEDKTNNRYLNPPTIDLDFDLRSRLPSSLLTPSTVGYSIGLCSMKFKRLFSLNSTRFWILAQKCVSMTNKLITSGEVRFMQHFFNNIITNEQLLNKFGRLMPDGRMSEINMSNIGKYPYSCVFDHLRLRGLHVINNVCVYHPGSVVFITCAGDGQLDISLAHEIESEEKAQEFLDYYIQLIEKCADANTEITLQQLLTSVEH